MKHFKFGTLSLVVGIVGIGSPFLLVALSVLGGFFRLKNLNVFLTESTWIWIIIPAIAVILGTIGVLRSEKKAKIGIVLGGIGTIVYGVLFILTLSAGQL